MQRREGRRACRRARYISSWPPRSNRGTSSPSPRANNVPVPRISSGWRPRKLWWVISVGPSLLLWKKERSPADSQITQRRSSRPSTALLPWSPSTGNGVRLQPETLVAMDNRRSPSRISPALWVPLENRIDCVLTAFIRTRASNRLLHGGRSAAGRYRPATAARRPSRPPGVRPAGRHRPSGSRRSGRSAGTRPAASVAVSRTAAASGSKDRPVGGSPRGRLGRPPNLVAGARRAHRRLVSADGSLSGQLFHLLFGRHAPACGSIGHA
jgi:hypothetical protein